MALSLVRSTARDYLGDPFRYDLAVTASYITEKHYATFHSLSSGRFTPATNPMIKITISDGSFGFMDPTTARLRVGLINLNGTNQMRLASVPGTLFNRVRVLCRGTVIEDKYCHHRLATSSPICTRTSAN
jgi:hypothetical protein